MEATKVGEDSTIQRMIRLVQSADAGKAKIVGLADRWATWILVISLSAAALTWLISGEIIRAVTILVVFCPCALVLATPTAIKAAIAFFRYTGLLAGVDITIYKNVPVRAGMAGGSADGLFGGAEIFGLVSCHLHLTQAQLNGPHRQAPFLSAPQWGGGVFFSLTVPYFQVGRKDGVRLWRMDWGYRKVRGWVDILPIPFGR